MGDNDRDMVIGVVLVWSGHGTVRYDTINLPQVQIRYSKSSSCVVGLGEFVWPVNSVQLSMNDDTQVP